MRRILDLLMALVVVLGFSMSAHASLIVRGTDTLGNPLIYDDDLDITWYDYSNGPDNWANQMSWAEALEVNFGGTIFDDWRLPSSVDGPYSFGYDGTTTAGYNITTSEMGHLFFTELGNLAFFGTDADFQPGYGLTHKGPFQNLIASRYWSGTEQSAAPSGAWHFRFDIGLQDGRTKSLWGYALAVRDGDVVAAIPEPSTMLLLGSGLVGLILSRKRLERIHGGYRVI